MEDLPVYSEFLSQALLCKLCPSVAFGEKLRKNPVTLEKDRQIRIAVLICIYFSVNFLHYRCPWMDFIVIKSGFTPE